MADERPIKRLLVVDDEPGFGLFVERTAEGLGFEVLVTTSGQQFMEAYPEFAPTVIVLDIVMPKIDGMELVQWLAKEGYAGQLIVVSGYAPNYAALAGRLAEATGRMDVSNLAKPVAHDELAALLAQGFEDR